MTSIPCPKNITNIFAYFHFPFSFLYAIGYYLTVTIFHVRFSLLPFNNIHIQTKLTLSKCTSLLSEIKSKYTICVCVIKAVINTVNASVYMVQVKKCAFCTGRWTLWMGLWVTDGLSFHSGLICLYSQACLGALRLVNGSDIFLVLKYIHITTPCASFKGIFLFLTIFLPPIYQRSSRCHFRYKALGWLPRCH